MHRSEVNRTEVKGRDKEEIVADEKRVLLLDDFEQRLVVNGLTDFRNELLREDKPTEAVDDLILKVIDAPLKREKRRVEREAR